MTDALTPPRARSTWWWLATILASGLVVRLALVWITSGVGLNVVDEQHYATLAQNLVEGNGFAWGKGQPTSIRPPLFPMAVAAVWEVAPGSLTAVRLAQIPLALLTVALVFAMARRLFGDRVALVSAAIVTFYPSLLFSGVLVLSEVLFTALLALTLFGCFRLLDRPTWPVAFLTGVALGASALTRSVMWPFLPLLVIGGVVLLRAPLRVRVALMTVATLGYLCVVAPWSVRNTRLQGTFAVVDTMGGLNLMMGNYAHTPEDRMWDAVALTGAESWSAQLPARGPDGRAWTEGTKERWANAQAREYILGNPTVFTRRAVLKFADFWGIERDFLAGVQRGVYHMPNWVSAPAAAAVVIAYAALMVLAVLGVCLAPPEWRHHVVLLTVMLFICAVHTVVFGHPRYHLPLVPVLSIYAAAALCTAAWRRALIRPAAGALACVLLLSLGAIWAHEIVRDAGRLSALVDRVSQR
jgi:4-amino-4-deoxy-L-arabinose transferase-like glycosyltransferase